MIRRELPLAVLTCVYLLSASTIAESIKHSKKGLSAAGVEYSLRTPPGYAKSSPRELWLLLHGSGDTHENFMRFWAPLPCLADAALLVPQASKGRFWSGDELPAILALLDELALDPPPERVYLSGFSAGAGMTYVCGLQHRERFAGLMPYAGSFSSPPPPGEHDLPIVHIHGELDIKVSFAQAEACVAALEAAGYSMVRLRKLANTNHILREHAVAGGVAWLRAHSKIPAEASAAELLIAAHAAKDTDANARARVLAETAKSRVGASVDGAASESEEINALIAKLDEDAVKAAQALARKIPKAKDRDWQIEDDLLRAEHPTPAVEKILDDAIAELAAKHNAKALPLLETGNRHHDKEDYPRAISAWAQIQNECYLSDACKLADQRINEYLTDPKIKAKLNVR